MDGGGEFASKEAEFLRRRQQQLGLSDDEIARMAPARRDGGTGVGPGSARPQVLAAPPTPGSPPRHGRRADGSASRYRQHQPRGLRPEEQADAAIADLERGLPPPGSPGRLEALERRAAELRRALREDASPEAEMAIRADDERRRGSRGVTSEEDAGPAAVRMTDLARMRAAAGVGKRGPARGPPPGGSSRRRGMGLDDDDGADARRRAAEPLSPSVLRDERSRHFPSRSPGGGGAAPSGGSAALSPKQANARRYAMELDEQRREKRERDASEKASRRREDERFLREAERAARDADDLQRDAGGVGDGDEGGLGNNGGGGGAGARSIRQNRSRMQSGAGVAGALGMPTPGASEIRSPGRVTSGARRGGPVSPVSSPARRLGSGRRGAASGDDGGHGGGARSAYARELADQMREKKEREARKKREDSEWDMRKEREAEELARVQVERRAMGGGGDPPAAAGARRGREAARGGQSGGSGSGSGGRQGRGRSREFDHSEVPGLSSGGAGDRGAGASGSGRGRGRGSGGDDGGDVGALREENSRLKRRVATLEIEVEEAVAMLEMYREQFGSLRMD